MRCRLKPDERFDVIMQRHGDGARPALEIRCVTCDARSHVKHAGKHWPPTEILLQKFEREGWSLQANTRRFDKCPDCVAKLKTGKAEKPKTESPVTTESNVTPLRSPALADRRKILEDLEALYDPAKQAYSGAWSDEKLAQKLQMPRA